MNIYKLAYSNDGHFQGFFIESIHSTIPEQHINIDEELWKELLSKQYKIKSIQGLNKYTVYTLNNLGLFEEYVIEQPNVPQEPALQDRVDILEAENAELLKDSALKDIKLEMVENDMADIMKEIALGGI